MNICVVVQRYGDEIIGGAETLARDVSERLALSGKDVTVFTTCAKDYITWEDHYEDGETYLKGVKIVRFKVDKNRDIESFNRFSEEIFNCSEVSEKTETQWIEDQGPYSPSLVEALGDRVEEFDIFIFFTYLYYPVIEGMKLVKGGNKPVLFFPTAHDEPPIYLKLMENLFKLPDSILFLTGAEKSFVEGKFNPPGKLELVRSGIQFPGKVDEKIFRQRYGISGPFIVYAGRIEEGKGLKTVFDGFGGLLRYNFVTLVLMGKKLMDIPDHKNIKYVGFVSEEEKMSAFNGAIFSVQPSPLESLSITTLESFTQGTPVLVNSSCEVLMEHVTISEGGCSFSDAGSFVAEAEFLLQNREIASSMGVKGFHYAREYYSWNKVMKKIEQIAGDLI